MLRDEVELYTKLSGNDGRHTPIGIIGAYLDGYEKGLESRETIHGEWALDESDNSVTCNRCGCQIYPNDILNGEANFCPNCGCDNRDPLQMAKDILHKAVDNTSMAEDAYPGIREKLHKIIEEDIPMEYFESGGK